MSPLALLLVAAPPFVVEDLAPRDAIVQALEHAFDEIARKVEVSAGTRPDGLDSKLAIRVRRARDLGPAACGKSRPSEIEIRQTKDGELDASMAVSIRHEVAHQVLLLSCPNAAGDRLFEEAFALAASEELPLWRDDEHHLSTPKALETLRAARSLDTRAARLALARLLADAPPTTSGLPAALERRVARCASGARWTPIALEELAGDSALGDDALIVLSRHSGEVLHAEGAVHQAMPFGSVLKPFVVAGAGQQNAPTLRPDPSRAEWACGDGLPEALGVEMALIRSCNGYFLDWGQRAPAIAGFGAYGPILLELGLSSVPRDIAEAIGIDRTLTISPWAVAQAYRVLAESDQEILRVLTRTPLEGTLSKLAGAQQVFGVSFKTGTVRDAASRPALGWIAAVSQDRVLVMVRKERAPRTFFSDFVAAYERSARRGRADQAANVQVFGLLSPETVRASCVGLPVIAKEHEPAIAPPGEEKLLALVERGSALCLGGPWRVQIPSALVSRGPGRDYAGVFGFSPHRGEPGDADATERQRRARRGSDLSFRTSLLDYTLGVIDAEDGPIRGEARRALAQVIAHNAAETSRHGGRPVCDTTHCQAFLGTRIGKPADAELLGGTGLIDASGWLLFSRGGEEPWQERRTREEVESALGRGATHLSFEGSEVRYLREDSDGEARFDQQIELGCERVRSPLRLPSCPSVATETAQGFLFQGRGRGHGQGLDLEHAKKSGQSAQAILDQAYGR
jgi:hypothetical protein